MKRLGFCVVAAAIYLGLPVAAGAQGLMPGFKLGDEKHQTPEEKAKADALEKAARAAQSTVPTEKASDDPWAGARTAEQSSAPKSTAAKPKKPKALVH
jgi:hypothetical protein